MSLRRKLEQLARARTEPPAVRSDDERRRAWYAANPVTPEQGARARAEILRRAQSLAEQADAGDQHAAGQLQRLMAALEAAAARRTA